MKTIIIQIFALCLTINIAYGQCSLRNLDIKEITCNNNGQIDVVIDFDHDQSVQDEFTVYYNDGFVQEYKYATLPLTLLGLDSNPDNVAITVVDKANKACYLYAETQGVDCNAPCQVLIQNKEVSSCKTGGKIDVAFDLVANPIYGDQYIITNDMGFEQTINRNERVILNDISTGIDVITTFTICSLDDNTCCTQLTVENPCICNMYDITYKPISCVEGVNYGLEIDFKYNMTSDSFTLGGDLTNYGNFAYADLPIQVNTVAFDATFPRSMLILDKASSFCFSSIELDTIGTCSDLCYLNIAEAEIIACNESTYNLSLNIDSKYTGSQGFNLYMGNTFIGNYNYNENDQYEINDLPLNCHTYPQLIVEDATSSVCRDTLLLEYFPCCDKSISIDFEEPNCIENKVAININNMNTTQDTVELQILQNGNSIYTENIISKSSVEIPTDNFQEGYYTIIYGLKGLKKFTSYWYYVCGCTLRDMTATPSECKDDGTFDVTLSFLGTGISDSFNIKGNGNDYGTFAYNQSPYIISGLAGDCSTVYEFEMRDVVDLNCRTSVAMEEAVCCDTDCSISNITVIDKGCTSETTTLEINFDHKNSESAVYLLTIDQEAPKVLAYTDLPTTVQIPTRIEHKISIKDAQNEDCVGEATVPSQCDCVFDNIIVERISCVDGLGVISMDLDYSFESNVVVLLNDTYEGLFSKEDFPIEIENVIYDGETESNIRIQSAIDTECKYTHFISPKTCMDAVEDFDTKFDLRLQENLLIINGLTHPADIELFTLDGMQIIQYKDVHGGYIELPTSLNTGIYLLRVTTNGNHYTTKLPIVIE